MKTTLQGSIELVKALAKRFVLAVAALAVVLLTLPSDANAYPIFAQQQYATPREATGRIVCANCHLAKKTTQVEVPQAVLPDTVFEAVVKVPYDHSIQQYAGDGSETGLNVGAVVVLPEGFTMAPEDRIPEDIKEEVESMYIQPYSDEHPNMLVVGPLSGDDYEELKFPILSPDPKEDATVHYGKYIVSVGGNRGRGQIYPTGEKSNNTVYNASTEGVVSEVVAGDDGGSIVRIQDDAGNIVDNNIPPGPQVLVAVGDEVDAGEAITNNPNVGGFGQADGEITLQNPARVQGLIAFFAIVTLAQILLVLKKKQVEKVQAAEMNF
ncbi:apocytochrome f [filamentous cyanobacterium LEGE 11480]|uniref:Cytochrome f n=1 Tax=Romeriopsis navalis LEGE 11480 TaxID=2777977 RepID=A0A928Z5C6_9CYAN|nr:apocytochrome f [Romeriopsis navalis]MBE9031862.1 apocytochrome f [Romeriopsis navalis LEGE 11480]